MVFSPVSEMQVIPGWRGGGGALNLPNWVLAGLYVERHLDRGAHSQVNWDARTACPYSNWMWAPRHPWKQSQKKGTAFTQACLTKGDLGECSLIVP